MYRSFLNIVKKNKWIIVILVIYLSPCILLASLELYNLNIFNSFKSIFHALVSLYLILLPICFFNLKIRPYFIVLSPFFALIPILLYSILSFGKLPTKTVISIVIDSNWAEISMFLNGKFLLILLSLLLPVAILYISLKYLPQKQTLRVKSRLWILFSLVFLFASAFCFKTIQRNTIKGTLKVSAKVFIKDTPAGFGLRLYRVLKNVKKE